MLLISCSVSLSLDKLPYALSTLFAASRNPALANVETVEFVIAAVTSLPFKIALVALLTAFVINLPSKAFWSISTLDS